MFKVNVRVIMFKTASQLDNKNKPAPVKFRPEDYVPRKLAINYRPPMIILEYEIMSTEKLYHRRMKIQNWNEMTEPKTILACIRKRYTKYFVGDKITDDQFLRLIGKLKEGYFNGKINLEKKAKEEPSEHTKHGLHSSISVQKDMNINYEVQSHNLKAKSPKSSPQPAEEQIQLKDPNIFVKNNFEIPEKRQANEIKTSELNPVIQNINPKTLFSNEPQILNIVKADTDSIGDDFESIAGDSDADFDDIPDEISDKPVNKKSVLELSQIEDINSSQLDLNKYGTVTVNKAKERMDEDFKKKQVTNQDLGFVYDKRTDFNQDESNDWDVDIDDF